MKRTAKWILMLLVVGMLATSMAGCFGGFNLTRKLWMWNNQMGDKWINTIVMWAMLFVPVYEIAGAADFFLLNTIEFWTGENPVPLAGVDGERKTFEHNGETYEILVGENRVDIRQMDSDKAATLVFDETTGVWTLQTDAGSRKIAQVQQDELTLFTPSGHSIAVAR